MAHARRKVFESRDNSPVHASMLLLMFRQLYDIEDRGKAFSPDDRLALRHAESRPIWERMREYLASEATMDVRC
ncbi:MAG: transposase [Planctomycetia bacterium]|nr:transposase [Planctomycetia bacterium]